MSKKIAAAAAALILIICFMNPFLALVFVVNGIKFIFIYGIVDLGCRLVVKKHLIQIIRDGLHNEDDY